MSTFAGSPYYIAPEVLKGNYDNKCDIWSIGIITYVMLTGILPYEGESNAKIFNKILTEEVNYNHPKFNFISNEAKEFIKLCLEKDPQKRISAQKLIENNWIKNALSKDNILKSNILSNLKKLNIKNKMKILILSYIVNNLSQKELQKLQEAFYAIDLDHTGQICLEELYKACEDNNIPITKNEINNIIQNLNICYNRASNNNVLDYQQFLMAVYDIEKNIDRNQIEKAFEFFDINHDGFIDVDDLKNFYLRSGLKVLNKDEEIIEIIKEISKNEKKIQLDHFLQLFNFI
jgi:calcium-dependent protein kinase